MAEENQQPEAAPAAAPAPSGGNKLVTILTIVNLLLTVGVIGVLLVSFSKENSKPKIDDMVIEEGAHEGADGKTAKEGEGHGTIEEAAKEDETKTRMINLEQFTVNLSAVGSSRPRFARVNISVEVATQDTENELGRKMPQVRNTIIDLFNSKRPSDLSTPDGRNYLKDEIRNSLNSFLITGKLKGVYFTAFALGS